MNYIAFPGLGLEFNVNPVAFEVFDRPIYWYGVIIAIGFLLATIYLMRRYKTFGYSTQDDPIDMLLIAAPIGFICARIYYVIFSWDLYKDNPIDAIKIWEGGIAIYGGVIGGAIGIIIYSKWKKKNLLSVLDSGAAGLLLAQSIGRWGNFVNAEAFGGETTSIFRMVLSPDADMSIGQHPTFLYESVWNIIGFVIIYFISKKAYKFAGQITLIYAAWYGFGRGIIEGMRTDSLWWGDFRVSQVLGFATSLISIVILIAVLVKTSKDKTYKELEKINKIAEETEEILSGLENEINETEVLKEQKTDTGGEK